MWAKEDVVWLAGFFDGEGHISLRRYKESGERVRIQVSIGQKDRSVLEWIQERFGGKIYGPYPPHGGAQLIWRNSERLGILKAIRPYLRTKRAEQADLVIEILEYDPNYWRYLGNVGQKPGSEARPNPRPFGKWTS